MTLVNKTGTNLVENAHHHCIHRAIGGTGLQGARARKRASDAITTLLLTLMARLD